MVMFNSYLSLPEGNTSNLDFSLGQTMLDRIQNCMPWSFSLGRCFVRFILRMLSRVPRFASMVSIFGLGTEDMFLGFTMSFCCVLLLERKMFFTWTCVCLVQPACTSHCWWTSYYMISNSGVHFKWKIHPSPTGSPRINLRGKPHAHSSISILNSILR